MRTLLATGGVLLLCGAVAGPARADGGPERGFDPVGYLSLGVRNTLSIFTVDGKAFDGLSAGGQLAIRFSEDFNSHWFGDWILSDVDGLAKRVDFHSGFSMMPKVAGFEAGGRSASLYPIGGFCLDYTKFQVTNGRTAPGAPGFLERYSFAAQIGFGLTLPLADRLDFSVETHYMLHIGTDIDIELPGEGLVELTRSHGTQLEGHYFLAVSMDYKLFRLWRRKSS